MEMQCHLPDEYEEEEQQPVLQAPAEQVMAVLPMQEQPLPQPLPEQNDNCNSMRISAAAYTGCPTEDSLSFLLNF